MYLQVLGTYVLLLCVSNNACQATMPKVPLVCVGSVSTLKRVDAIVTGEQQEVKSR